MAGAEEMAKLARRATPLLFTDARVPESAARPNTSRSDASHAIIIRLDNGNAKHPPLEASDNVQPEILQFRNSASGGCLSLRVTRCQ